MNATNDTGKNSEKIFVRGVRLTITQSRTDNSGRKILDVNSDDGTLFGTGYSRDQAVSRAKKKLQ